MPLYQVSWNVYGATEVEADNETQAREIAYDQVLDEITIEWDGFETTGVSELTR